MRGLVKYIQQNWYPIGLVGGATGVSFGLAALLYNLTAWLVPHAQPWPAVVVGGFALIRAVGFIRSLLE